MTNEVKIIKTGTWFQMDLDKQTQHLNECIRDYVEETEKIINIQLVHDNGHWYFLIYTAAVS